MKRHLHFRRFLASEEGQRVLARFNSYKKDIENPPESIRAAWRSQKVPGRYLEIGGGTGQRTLELARKLGCHHIDFVEPSSAACRVFRARSTRAGIPCTTVTAAFEKFRTQKRYDLITAIHSFYYINRASLAKVYRLLAPGGKAFILLDSRRDVIKRLQDLCESWQGERTNNAEDLCESLRRAKIPHRTWPDTAAIRGLYRRGKFSRKAQIILSLLSWTPWSALPDSVKDKAKDLLLALSPHDEYVSRRVLIEIRKPLRPRRTTGHSD